ncbi:MAG: hypothetical protein KGQ37_02600 [Hyphomicrobiales bacterium]|nr:hypothetical protein [Hyphomicrobiales bacterium]
MSASVPPLPQPTLQIGVIGHRALPDADLALLADKATEALAGIIAAARKALPEPARSRLQLRCISSLAEGSDCLLTEAALAQGCALAAPLPFQRALYARDFTDPAALARHERLLAQSASVYEIDAAGAKAESYLAASRILLAQSDIVLAIWDGDAERGIGGTAQTIREALLADIPVLVIAAQAPHALHVPGDDMSASPQAQIERWMQHLLAPLPARPRHDAMAQYLAEQVKTAPVATWFVRSVERWLLLAAKPQPQPQSEPPPDLPDAADDPLRQFDEVIEPHRRTLDQLATRYGALYRAAFTVRLLAVLPATAFGIISLYAAPTLANLGLSGQLLVLAVTLVIAGLDARLGWHRRFVAYRYLAEHLRQSRLLALFGTTGALAPPHFDRQPAPEDWADAVLRRIVRAAGLPPLNGGDGFIGAAAAIICREMAEQRDFYLARAAKFAVLGQRLKRAGTVLYVAGFGFTLLRLILGPSNHVPGLATTLALLAMIAPALSPVFFGLRSWNEYASLADRYRVTGNRLTRLLQLYAMHPANRAKLETIAAAATTLMLAETRDWHSAIKGHDLKPL